MFDSLIPDALIHLDSGFQSNISGFRVILMYGFHTFGLLSILRDLASL